MNLLWSSRIFIYASFAVLEDAAEEPRVTRYTVPYDVERVRRDYVESGAAAAAPELCRCIYQTMRTGEPMLALKFMRHVRETAQAMGLSPEEEAAWRAADANWDGWTEKGVTAGQFWGL